MLAYIHKRLFYLLVFLIPVNLAKNFISKDSYVSGVLVDYLIPSFYVTDIVLLLVLSFWILDLLFSVLSKAQVKESNTGLLTKTKTVPKAVRFSASLLFVSLLLLFLLLIFLSADFSFFPSVYKFLRYLEFFGLFLYLFFTFSHKDDFNNVVIVLSSSVFFQGILAFAQFVKGRSVFNNYLFFVEQPYSYITPGVVYKDYLGALMITPYGTFPHPNVLAGFSTFCLIVALYYTFKNGFSFIVSLGVLYSFFILVLTKSYISLAGVLFVMLGGLVAYLINSNKKLKAIKPILLGGFLVVSIICGTLFWLLLTTKNGFGSEYHSVFRRVDLVKSSLSMATESSFKGVGLNMFTVFLYDYGGVRGILKFVQPVHNTFLLLLSESGLFSLVAFMVVIYFYVYSVVKSYKLIYFCLISFILFVSVFDHYFLTLQQGQLVFWLTLGMGASTIKADAYEIKT